MSLGEARAIVDWMVRGEEDGGGGKRAEWIDPGSKTSAWIWWRRPEEWAGFLVDWVSRGALVWLFIDWDGLLMMVSIRLKVLRRRMSFLLFMSWYREKRRFLKVGGLDGYHLVMGCADGSEWHGMDQDVMMKTLNVLVKRGKAQVFGSEGQEGVKFF